MWDSSEHHPVKLIGSGTAQLAQALARRSTACLSLALIGLLAAFGWESGQQARATPIARAGKVMSVRDEGRLRLIKSSGSLLIDEGPASGTLPGKVRVRFVYNGAPTVSAQITISGRAGSISARGNGRLSSLTSANPSFTGALTISGASGRYASAHGSGHLYGVFDRRTYAMTVQARGTFDY